MPVLELSVDARGVQQGLSQADRALDQTAKRAKVAEDSMRQVSSASASAGNNLSAAFAATGGGLSVTRGLVSIGDGLRSANVGMATFAASQALLDLGRLSADLRSVSSATGVVGGAFGRLGAIIKANPLLTIATLLAGAATAMGIFGKSTDSTTSKIKEQTSALDTLNAKIVDVEARVALGQADPRGGVAPTIDAIRALQTERQTDRGRIRAISPSDAARLFGVTEQELRYALANSGVGESALELQQGRARFGVSGQGEFGAPAFSRLGFSVDEVTGAGRYLLDQRRRQAEQQRIEQFYLGQRQGGSILFGQDTGANQFDVNFGSPSTAGDLIRQTPEERAQIDADIRTRNIEQAQIGMDRLIQQGEQFGATIGDAFFNVASGAQTARQAIAAIVSDLARATAQRGFAGIFGSVAGSFGKTGVQAAGDSSPGNGSNLTLPD
jgi:hypothetical protein